MNTTFTEMKKTMQAHWKAEWSKDVTLIPVARAFNTSLDAIEALARQVSTLRQGGKFSEQGLTEEVRTLAAAETVPVLKKANADIERVRKVLGEQRAHLAIPQPDPANAAEAIMRSEMRTWLRSLPQTQAAQVLLAEGVDDRMLQAVFEGPAIMSGLSEELRDKVREQVTKRKFGPQMAQVEEHERAVEQAQAAMGVSLYQLRQEAMFGNGQDHLFDGWMSEASGKAEEVEAQISPDEFLAIAMDGVREEVDEIFAKAFPALYPDHPANKKVA